MGSKSGKINFDKAYDSKFGVAILSVLFEVIAHPQNSLSLGNVEDGVFKFVFEGKNRVKWFLNPGAYIRRAIKKTPYAAYWTYKGSLTSPDCDEAVTWVVFRRVLPIAHFQVRAFSLLNKNNCRKPRAATADHQVLYLRH